MRSSLRSLSGLTAAERFREEDPFTDLWTTISDNRIIGTRSRFEVDLNRPPTKAVYRTPEDCWGLPVWKEDLPMHEVEHSMVAYDAFYAGVEALLIRLLTRHERVVIYDIHSYNHQRKGPGILDDPELNPEVNLGTAHMHHDAWAAIVEALAQALRHGPDGRMHDVRENVKFKGGFFSQWLHQRFGARVCPVAIEFKKVFMNEWTGAPDPYAVADIAKRLAASVPRVLEHLNSPAHA